MQVLGTGQGAGLTLRPVANSLPPRQSQVPGMFLRSQSLVQNSLFSPLRRGGILGEYLGRPACEGGWENACPAWCRAYSHSW